MQIDGRTGEEQVLIDKRRGTDRQKERYEKTEE